MFRRLSAVLSPRDPREAEAGFTVIEVMVAMMVFAVMSLGIAYGIVNAMQLSQSSRGRETAIALASQDIDNLRQLAASSSAGIQSVVSAPLTASDAPLTKTIGGVKYTITRVVNWVNSAGTSDSCGSQTTSYLAYKSVAETVSWAGRVGTLSTTVTSSIAPSSAVTTPGDGTITISVKTAAGAGNAGVTINVTPVSGGTGATLTTQPAVTNGQGCTIAVNVQPGNYTVTAYEAGGIDTNQATTSSQSPISVLASANSYVPFVYDQAASIDLQFASTYGATLPQSMPTTLYSTGGGYDYITPWGTSPTVTSSTKTPTSVFPFGNYTVFAGKYNPSVGSGSCLSPNPGAWSTANSSGKVGTAPSQIGTSAGQSATPDPWPVMMGVIQASGMNSSTYVVATTASTSGSGDPGCSSGYTLQFPTSSSGTQKLALPFGTWTVQLYSSVTGKVLGVLSGAGITNVTGGTTSGNVLTGYTVVVDPRGQTS
jgi:prepilin-type N-terminal cleavage/methylation domain-containing protein